MALVEKSRFGSKPAVSVRVNVEPTARRTNIVFSVMAAVAVMVALFRAFTMGHPILAIWTAAAILAWLFIRGAGGAAESD
jgi:hypothetical protein